MSIVGAYPQPYPPPAEFYGYHPQQSPHVPQRPYHEQHHPDQAYFQGWMLGSQPPHGATAAEPMDMGGHYSPGTAMYGPHGAAPLTDHYKSVQLFDVMPDGTVKMRTVKRKATANKKERRRTLSINSAFANLRGCIPNVPSDTKLSKIKTLRLATSYIAYLMDILNKDDPTLDKGGFKAEIKKKIESREEKRRREAEEILRATSGEKKRSKGRTGWPQAVWASELGPNDPNNPQQQQNLSCSSDSEQSSS